MRRMKQRLLYQIGLTNDPWLQTDDHIHDRELSDASGDYYDGLRINRSKSFDKWLEPFGKEEYQETVNLLEPKCPVFKSGKAPLDPEETTRVREHKYRTSSAHNPRLANGPLDKRVEEQ